MKKVWPVQLSKLRSWGVKGFVWLIAAGCFYLVYDRIDTVASAEGQTAWQYLARFFAEVNWGWYLLLMMTYSVFFVLVDSHALWRVIRWFNLPEIKWTQLFPIRASAYILSLMSEQVGKGGLALYLYKKHQVPLLQGISSMLYSALVEVGQLLMFAAIGLTWQYQAINQTTTTDLPLAQIILFVILAAALFFVLHVLYFSGRILPHWDKLRKLQIFHSFARSSLARYGLLVLFKAPAMLGAMVVYWLALGLFNVPVSFADILTFLPLIFVAATLPLPFHAGALVLWVLLFPDFPEVGAFAFVMSLVFVGLNAVIGLLFVPHVNQVLLTQRDPAPES